MRTTPKARQCGKAVEDMTSPHDKLQDDDAELWDRVAKGLSLSA